jgi:hypothetical protein
MRQWTSPGDPHGRKSRALFGPSLTAFGQPGTGGSHAFADPENGISFADVMNPMELGILPNRKAMDRVVGGDRCASKARRSQPESVGGLPGNRIEWRGHDQLKTG